MPSRRVLQLTGAVDFLAHLQTLKQLGHTANGVPRLYEDLLNGNFGSSHMGLPNDLAGFTLHPPW